jgi:biopolymer transport protein ExbB
MTIASENRAMYGSRSWMLVILALFAVFAGTWAPQARAWWNDDWAFRKEIKFDLTKAGADIPGSPADVPVLIRLSLANFGYFADTAPDGADLRFIAADDKTALKYHVERYDPQGQIAFLWVRVPRLTGGVNTDKLFLYYGNKKAQAGADAGGTYDKNQVLVYHFGAAAGSAQDATSYKTEPSAFKAVVNPASLIGSGAQFKGAETITTPATAGLRLIPKQGFTLTAWVRVEAAQSQAYVAVLQEAGKELVLGINGTQAFARINDGSGSPVSIVQSAAQGNGALSTGEWHHLGVRVGGGQLTLLVDGVEAASPATTVSEIGGTLTLGGSAQGANFLTGELDELQVSNTARPTEWLATAARSQGMVAPLVVYGGDAQKESGGNQSYFGTTLRNVTIDGWVIICVLAVLFIASLIIMTGKLIYLSRVAGGNAKFLAEFRKMGDDPSTLERREGGKKGAEEEESAFEEGHESQLMAALTSSKDAFGISTLWRLYHHGMRETMKRVEGQAAGADRVKTLSAQSIEAIRATMDASLTRMTQRLNAQMVWLTISIAGGPFLGLLGTVVGVMITFAAIAASGEVNINAIAPGTAAALVATVAGLGVAIPCLFGYNYLNSRIREIVADMRVFVDEFVTRIAESYS